MARVFRHAITFAKLVPWWLWTGEGGLLLHSFGSLLDLSNQRLKSGLMARFPHYAGRTAQALLAYDRAILRGRDETDLHFAGRLVRWRSGHRVRGNPWALLEQVQEYFGNVFGASTVDASGELCSRTADGTETVTSGDAWSWNHAGETSADWARFWIILGRVGSDYTENPAGIVAWADADEMCAGIGTDAALGFDGATGGDFDALRGLVQNGSLVWRPGGTTPEWLVLAVDAEAAPGDYTAVDNWATWGEDNGSGKWIPVRPSGLRFVSLKPSHNNTFSGDPDVWSLTVDLLTSSDEAGDPDIWGEAITLLGGETLTGDPDIWGESVTLLDDGS